MPTILVDIFVIVALLYLVVAVLIVSGNNREFPRRHHTPTVSVVVAARTEQDSILNCLQSLAEQDYPEDRIEYIIIDDRSDDKTGEIVKSFSTTYNSYYKILGIDKFAIKIVNLLLENVTLSNFTKETKNKLTGFTLNEFKEIGVYLQKRFVIYCDSKVNFTRKVKI